MALRTNNPKKNDADLS